MLLTGAHRTGATKINTINLSSWGGMHLACENIISKNHLRFLSYPSLFPRVFLVFDSTPAAMPRPIAFHVASFPASKRPCRSHNHSHARRELVVCSASPRDGAPRLTRRSVGYLLALASQATMPVEAGHCVDVPRPRTVLNGVLSGYGLPTVGDAKGTTRVSEQYGDNIVVEFLIPASWLIIRAQDKRTPTSGRTSGLTAGDYRHAEGVAFYASREGKKSAWSPEEVAELVTPGDAIVGKPIIDVISSKTQEDGSTLLETKFESTTQSGYVVERRALTRSFTTKDGTLYALAGTCTAARWKKAQPNLLSALASFQVFRI